MSALLILLCLICAVSLQNPGSLAVLLRKARYYPTSLTGPYQAPLRYCFMKPTVERSYRVSLHRGSSFEAHKHAVGDMADVDTKITRIDEGYHGGLLYRAETVDDKLLEGIRADIMVDWVECLVLEKVVLIGDCTGCTKEQWLESA